MRLHRPLPPGDDPVHLFALNYDVDRLNSDHLLNMDGDIKIYKSKDEGVTDNLSSLNTPERLYLKIGAPVILTANLNNRLVNGLIGKVVSFNDESVIVKFDNITSTQEIKSHVFTVYSPIEKRNIATREQIPLKLAFALTVHKAQGLSLDRVVVHCENMTTPGQIGVAVGRAVDKKGLRVIGFKKTLLKPQPKNINTFYSNATRQTEIDNACCKHSLTGNLAIPNHSDDMDDEDEDELLKAFDCHIASTSHQNHNGPDPCSSMFSSFSDFGDYSSSSSSMSSESCHLDVPNILANCRFTNPMMPKHERQNEDLDYLSNNLPKAQIFVAYIHSNLSLLLTEKNLDKHVSSSTALGKIFQFMGSTKYKEAVNETFEERDNRFLTAYSIVQEIQYVMLKTMSEKYTSIDTNPNSYSTPTSDAGKAKIRHIGGWVVGKILFSKKSYVTEHLFKPDMKEKVSNAHIQKKLLEELTDEEDNLVKTSIYPESLSETLCRQNATKSLTNVTDGTFEFFMKLEDKVQSLQTDKDINDKGQNLYILMKSEIKMDQELHSKWQSLFSSDDFIDEKKCLFGAAIDRYLNMCSGQLRRDLKRKLRVQKQTALRKRIKAPEQKAGKKCDKKTIEYPCGECKESCDDGAVCCDSCDTWHHFACVGLGEDEDLSNVDWLCKDCRGFNVNESQQNVPSSQDS